MENPATSQQPTDGELLENMETLLNELLKDRPDIRTRMSGEALIIHDLRGHPVRAYTIAFYGAFLLQIVAIGLTEAKVLLRVCDLNPQTGEKMIRTLEKLTLPERVRSAVLQAQTKEGFVAFLEKIDRREAESKAGQASRDSDLFLT